MRLLANIIIPLVGIAFLGLGAHWGWDTWAFVQRAESAQGKIERFEQRTSTKRRAGGKTRTRSYHAPVFTFQDAKGASHTVVSSTGSGKPAYEVGAVVPVLYDPAAPESARIRSFDELWLLPSIFGAIGLVCFAVVFFTRSRKS